VFRPCIPVQVSIFLAKVATAYMMGPLVVAITREAYGRGQSGCAAARVPRHNHQDVGGRKEAMGRC